MERSWYILYTRPGSEKKLAGSLAKRKIEYFLPFCNKSKSPVSFNKSVREPLFPGYVFVMLPFHELYDVQQVVGALGIVHWKGEPVSISAEEVHTIKEFTSTYNDISLVQTKIESTDTSKHIADPALEIRETRLPLKGQSFALKLPSIGFKMIADIGNVGEMRTFISHSTYEEILN